MVAVALTALVASMLVGCQFSAGSGGEGVEASVGDCFQTSSDPEVTDLDTVDCEVPHDREVFHIFDGEGEDDAYPGADALLELAGQTCASPLADYLGGDPIALGASASAIVPGEELWEDGGRTIICFLFAADETQIEGSAEGLGAGGAEPGDDVPAPAPIPPVDDPSLAPLADQCFAGSGTGCDELFNASPAGSEIEAWADLCGGRFAEPQASCVDAIGP